MEFKDLFFALCVIAIGIFGYIGLATTINVAWGTTITEDFDEDFEAIRIGLVGNLSERGEDVGIAGFEEEGQAPGDAQESLFRRGLRVLNTIPQMVGMPVKLIGAAGESLGIPSFITFLGIAAFAFSFFVTLAYLFITGARRIFGR